VTPQEHMTRAEAILAQADADYDEAVAEEEEPWTEMIESAARLATAHVTIALAMNTLPVLESSGKILSREPDLGETYTQFRVGAGSRRDEIHDRTY
jgi:hypothetical protein